MCIKLPSNFPSLARAILSIENDIFRVTLLNSPPAVPLGIRVDADAVANTRALELALREATDRHAR